LRCAALITVFDSIFARKIFLFRHSSTVDKMDRRSSSNVYSIRKFDGKNYKLWAFEMEMLLSREQAWTIVNGSEPSPPEPEEVDKDGKTAVPPSKAYVDYTWRYYEALRLIFDALEDSLQLQYMGIEDPAELWKVIKRNYVGELQKSQLWIRRDLNEVKLEDSGSVNAYAMRIQNLVDEYRDGATSATDRISDREHVFFLLNGIPQSDEWDVELRLIDSLMDYLAEDPKAVIKKLRAREDSIKSSKGISSEVALYTHGGLASRKSGKSTDRKTKDKRKDARTCHFCKQSGHTRRHCPERKKAASNTDAESIADSSDTGVSDTVEALDVETSPADAALARLMQDGPVKRAGAGGAKPAEKKATRAGGARLAENNTGKTSTGHVKSVVGGGAITAKLKNVTTVWRVEPIEGGGVISAKNVKASATGARKPVENVKTPRKGAGSAGGGSSFRCGTQRRGCAHCECAHCRQSWRSTAPIITQETLW
jgi:hypothetical protein